MTTPSASSTSRNTSISSQDDDTHPVATSPTSPLPGSTHQRHHQQPIASHGPMSPQVHATSTSGATALSAKKLNAMSTSPIKNDTSVRPIPAATNMQSQSGRKYQKHAPQGGLKNNPPPNQTSTTDAAGGIIASSTPDSNLTSSPGASPSLSPDGSEASSQGSNRFQRSNKNTGEVSGRMSTPSHKSASQDPQRSVVETPKSTKQDVKQHNTNSHAQSGLKMTPAADSQRVPTYQQKKLDFSERTSQGKPPLHQTQVPPHHGHGNVSHAAVRNSQVPGGRGTGHLVGKQKLQNQNDGIGVIGVQNQFEMPGASNANMDSDQRVKEQQEGSESGSFGYRTLKSVEVPLAGALPRKVGSLLDGMPPPDPSNFGPTIHPPSVSLSDPSVGLGDGRKLQSGKDSNVQGASGLQQIRNPHPVEAGASSKHLPLPGENKTTTDGFKGGGKPAVGIEQPEKMDQNLEKKMSNLSLANQTETQVGHVPSKAKKIQCHLVILKQMLLMEK